MKEFFKDCLYGYDGKASLVNTISFCSFITFAIVSMYLACLNIDWGGYSIFASFTITCATVGKVGDKYLNGNKTQSEQSERRGI